MTLDGDTIFALSSGLPPSAIAVIRLSGPQASRGLTTLAGKLPPPRVASRRQLRDANGEAIDDALVFWFPGPASATGEDVAEIHVHGSRAVVQASFAALGAVDGLRAALPGEFTRRAFENGKIDLTQAEAIDDLIHSDTDAQRRQAVRQLDGLLGDRARSWRQTIIDAAALIESGIDFSEEEDVPADALAPALEAVRRLRDALGDVLRRVGTERLRDGLLVAITGAPNVGKSTLINRLAGREVAIVSPFAGTTRDIIEVFCDFGGYPVTLIDTAGLRDTDDPVEQEGVRRARQRSAEADLRLWITDGNASSETPDGTGAEVWSIRNKADLDRGRRSVGNARFAISALTGEGIGELETALAAFAAGRFPPEAALISRTRHRQALEATVDCLTDALQPKPAELIAEDLRRAAMAIGHLLGRVGTEDILDSIFKNFCIGK